MRIAIPHHTTRPKARAILEKKIDSVISQFGHHADKAEHNWTGDVLDFKGKAKGFSLHGTVEVTDAEVLIDVKLPFLAMAFEPKIRQSVQKEAAAMFQKA